MPPRVILRPNRVSARATARFSLTIAGVLGGAACSSDGPGSDGGESGESGIDSLSASNSATEPTSDTLADTSSASDTDACAQEKVCEGDCCGADEQCIEGACEVVCEDERPPCGAAQACCAGEDVCWLGSCVTPGAACEVSGCATQPTVTTCSESEICEQGIGRCLPSDAAKTCIYEPPPAQFDPTPTFTWGQRRVRACAADADCQTSETCMADVCTPTWNHITPDVAPDFVQVMSVPAVIDLDQDCVPELVFNSYSAASLNSGLVRAIRGDDGSPVWTLDDPTYRADGGSAIAVGDLDGDGSAEIVVKGNGSFLFAVGADGAPLWRSDNFTSPTSRGSAAIANLDGEGHAEIVYGRAVYDSSGTLLWEGTGGVGMNGSGPISCVADLDDDGRPEVIAGRTAYTFTGTVAGGDFAGEPMWTADSGGDGFCGVADFDADGAPEVVLVASSTIYILDASDGSIIAQRAIPGGGNGGAPNIADFDGDGVPDIGTAGATRYVVVGYDGSATLELFWQAETEDDSSNRTGSSVFDFDGDGRNEVVYNDEEYLRIYPGVEPDCLLDPPGPGCDGVMTDDEILFRDLSSSRTDTEYPVIADVDGDFKAELIIVTNNEASHLSPELVADAGIEVWGDRLDNWVATRPIWNQHSYHITNVGLVGEIPMVEDPSWAPGLNSYRRNAQGDQSVLCAPDLIPYGLETERLACPSLELEAFVLNQGCLGVGPGVQVAFYEATLGLLGVVETTMPLPAGGSEKVALDVDLAVGGNYSITVSVDDDGTGVGALNECVEDNNVSEPLEACNQVG